MEFTLANTFTLLYLFLCALRGMQLDKYYKRYDLGYFVNCMIWFIMWPIELYLFIKRPKKTVAEFNHACAQQIKEDITTPSSHHPLHMNQVTTDLRIYKNTIDNMRLLLSNEDVALIGDAKLTPEQRGALSRINFACYQLDMLDEQQKKAK